jgi:uncharacterized alkaline shock family protein YloU
MKREPEPVVRAAPRPPTYPPPEDASDEHELGAIQIHNSVIAQIARRAAQKVPGVVELAGSIVDDLAGLVTRRVGDRGVRVEVEGDRIVLEIHIVVEYGVYIPKVAWQVQSAVREDVEKMTGRSVSAVNVIVQGVRVPSEEPQQIEAEPSP